jgi:CheY-like chemotaxis protein
MRTAGKSSDTVFHEPAGANDLTGMYVLIVEDDSDGREILERTIVAAGGNVIATMSSQDALNRLRECERLPEVIVVDIGMATDDGYSFLKQLRMLPLARGGSIPAIALTAYASPGDRAQALSAGFFEHFTKPFDSQTLLQSIARVGSATSKRGLP